ncbi:type VI secretion system membrane subunit TssM [Microbulbifer hydrolyticus]|uniref:Type VI secretion system membrane subunit TssM n=1 Tax=Microbulbifer hydrolyticus TaxID=48074 RepID=A0A6P1T804_9GAMM|nr:type VI secretion system membrane subunit TssM [Microbulbifer hydrolyticus]MBB5211400.1 type VI secretion system protein ImpL [Microbulbifer hydrolyticus]QHQ37845.1 type VI secretion system membrane subunit TssM [Microbulbifer hydrolyticus]
MRRLANFFANKWVLGLIGLGALALLIWFGAEYIKFGSDNATLSKGARITIIAFLFVIWLVWNLSQWLVERRQNQALIEGIESTRDEEVDPDQERSQEELQALADRFREAMQVLRKARFRSQRGQLSLYQLPWYIIIGPPGSGKTTALVNSGLEFPLAQSHGKEALGGVGGTRNCDWWFTNDAVLIDTAGRYTTQDSHRVYDNSAWRAFLSLLQKYRRRRPINGVLVAISLQDLMVQTGEQRAHQAKTIRARINELQQKLGVRFPIYLTFTKCDLVAGFSEFFDNLSQAEREQVWGVSFPEELRVGDGAPLEEFSAEFRALISRLNQRVLWRIHHERNLEKRALLQGFPARMESLQGVITEFVHQTFGANRYDTVPMVRGVYFTSGTQEGSPIDRMMASISSDFGLERDMGKKFQGAGKSYFLHRLLKDVVFPEAELVGVNRQFERATHWVRGSVYAASVCMLVAALTLWTGSITQNKLYMGEVEENLNAFKQYQRESDGRPIGPVDALALLDPLYTASTVYQKEEHPWLNNMGLYDDRVDEAADALYREKLNEIFLPALQQELERKLARLDSADAELTPTLKTYLMLFDEEKRDQEALKSYYQHAWSESLSGNAEKQEKLVAHLDRLLSQQLPAGRTPNDRVVAVAQQQLRRIPVAQRLYGQLQRGELANTRVDLYSDVGGDTARLFGVQPGDQRFQIPYLYTRAGYKDVDFGADSPLLKNLSQERWIYGGNLDGEDFSEKDLEKLGEQVKGLYLAEYHQRWQSFLASFSLKGYDSTQEAFEVLSTLSDPVYSPLLALSEIAADNTRLTPRPELPVDANGVPLPVSTTTRQLGGTAASSAINALADQYQPTMVDVRFEALHRLTQSVKGRPARIQEYLAAIAQVQGYVAEIDGGVDSNEIAFNKAKARFQGASDAIKQLRVKAANAPFPFDGWLEQVADNTWALVMAKAKAHVDRAWQQQVYDTYQRSLAQRYPLWAGSSLDAPMMQFNEFFKPGGVEQQFVQQYLKPFIDTRNWKPRVLDGRSLGLSSAALSQMKRAEIIRKTLFSTGEQAAYDFRIEPTKLDSGVRLFALELGGQRVPYSHGPRTSRTLDWRGGESNRARIIFEDLNETVHRQHFEGDWAWHRLIAKSSLERGGSNNEHLITFTESSRSAQFRLTASSAYDPFDKNLLSAYRCPQRL